jgi:SAF domain
VTAVSIRLHPEVSVAIALQDIEMGTILPDHGLKLVTAVKRGHKFALADFAVGDKLLRYGQIIGQAVGADSGGRACAYAQPWHGRTYPGLRNGAGQFARADAGPYPDL